MRSNRTDLYFEVIFSPLVGCAPTQSQPTTVAAWCGTHHRAFALNVTSLRLADDLKIRG
jgi:hypothetical protein